MLSKRDKVISQKILFRPTSKKTAMAEVYLLIAIKWDWILILILLFPRAWLRKDQKLEWNRLGTRKPKRCMSFERRTQIQKFRYQKCGIVQRES